MFISTLMLSISSSLDAMGIGITYGLRKTKFPFKSKLIFFIVSFVSTTLSILLGNIIINIFSPKFTTLLGSLLLTCIGFHAIFESFKKSKKFDFYNSNNISNKEALALSLSLTMDSLCIGIGGSMLGINIYLFPVFVASLHLTFLLIGNWIGKKLVNIAKVPTNIWSIISGVMLIVIGICKLV